MFNNKINFNVYSSWAYEDLIKQIRLDIKIIYSYPNMCEIKNMKYLIFWRILSSKVRVKKDDVENEFIHVGRNSMNSLWMSERDAKRFKITVGMHAGKRCNMLSSKCWTYDAVHIFKLLI